MLGEYYPDPSELRSGWIDVKLTAKTPLIIPYGSRYKKAEAKSPDRPGAPAVPENRRDNAPDPERFLKQYDFFRHPDGRCAIPGSSLRGMLRSMYEAASNSCLPFLLKDPLHPISQRTPLYAAFKNRGLPEYDSKSHRWRRLKVIKHRIPTTGEAVRSGVFQWGGTTYHTAQKVRFALTTGDGAESVVLGEGNGEGVLQFNVPVDLKNHYNVMVLEPVRIHDENNQDKYLAVEGWDEWLDELNKEDKKDKGNRVEKECEKIFQYIYGSVFDTVRNVKRNYSAQRDLKDALDRARRGDGTMVPVYWFKVERDGRPLYYLSGAAAGRVQQRRKWEEIMGEHSPCETLDIPSEEEKQKDLIRLGREKRYGLCPACALFGTVQDGGTRGRLRFTDAVAVTEPELTSHTLQILGEPRSSSFEFYLRKPDKDATYWNYDFYGVTRRDVKDGKTVEWTEYHDLPQATPRGRKFYWHSKPARDWDDELDKDKRKDMSASMEAASAGSEFAFR
ncbi:MAG: hypothetical protein IJT94_08825, partial [Oscillibacter sp.]|nr:hypothetical protein [Oscillibacter sp.]